MHVHLVKFKPEYLEFLSDLWKDPVVNRYTGIPPGGVDMSIWHEQYKKSKEKSPKSSEQFIILDDKDVPVGETAFGILPDYFIFGEWEKIHLRPCALADIKVVKKHWGKGIGTEAFKKLVRFVFENTGVVDIISIPHINNKRARKMYVSCGLRPTRKRNSYGNEVFIINRGDWENDQDNSISR